MKRSAPARRWTRPSFGQGRKLWRIRPGAPAGGAPTGATTRRNVVALHSAFLYAASGLACLSVYLLNAAPLVYIDTAAYLLQGRAALMQLGLAALPGEAAGAAANGHVTTDGAVSGSRSALYAVALHLAQVSARLNWMVVVNAALALAAIWLPARLITGRRPLATARLTAAAAFAACATSLPFYTAYLMPDIFAAILILALASMVAFHRRMTGFEWAGAGALAGLSVLLHPSHLAIAGLMLGAACLLAPLVGWRRFWLPVLAIAAVVASGAAERLAFREVVGRVTEQEVVYTPFITARLLEDGPAMRYLGNTCPEAGWASCALHARLAAPGGTADLRAEAILFSEGAGGSFANLSPDRQAAVAAEQIALAREVALAHPMWTAGSYLRNVWRQLRRTGIAMTVPDDRMLDRAVEMSGALPEGFGQGRLTSGRGWIAPVSHLHTAIYLTSLLAAAAIAVLRAPDRSALVFALALAAGIVANAAICGGLSVPADRYGARVAFLLPVAAVMLAAAGLARMRAPAN